MASPLLPGCSRQRLLTQWGRGRITIAWRLSRRPSVCLSIHQATSTLSIHRFTQPKALLFPILQPVAPALGTNYGSTSTTGNLRSVTTFLVAAGERNPVTTFQPINIIS